MVQGLGFTFQAKKQQWTERKKQKQDAHQAEVLGL